MYIKIGLQSFVIIACYAPEISDNEKKQKWTEKRYK